MKGRKYDVVWIQDALQGFKDSKVKKILEKIK